MRAGLVLAVALAACRDSTAPDRSFSVTAAIDVQPEGVFSDTPNGPLISCAVPVTLTAHGTGTGTWTGATELWFVGPDRTSAVDTTSNPASDLQQAFGTPTIAAGDTRRATWTFRLFAPFDATMSFNYTLPDGHTTGSASVHFTCGPSVQGAAAAAVTTMTTPATSGELNVGDTVSVSYTATGSSGIWVTIVDATGAFLSEQVFGEHLQTTVNRTVKFIVPSSVNPGVPLTFSVRAFNAALVGSAKSLETQLKVVDHIPPTLLSASIDNRLVSATGSGLAGQYAISDKFRLFASGKDNYEVGWLIYELGPPANVIDSLPATPHQTSMNWSTLITVRPEWVGAPLLRLYVRDASGLTSNVITSPTDSLRFYPIVTRPTTPPLVLSQYHETNDMVYDAKRDLMYVAIATENNVAVFSPSTMTLQAPITLPGAAGGMDLSLSGDSLLIAVPSVKSIAVVDLTHPTAMPSMLTLPVVDTAGSVAGMGDGVPMPADVRIMANAKMFVFLSWATRSNNEVVEVSLATGAQQIRTDARNLTPPVPPRWTSVLERSGDRSRLYVVTLCSGYYDAPTDTWVACIDPNLSNVFGVTTNTTGTQVTATNSIFDASLRRSWTADASALGQTVLGTSSDGAIVYIGAGKTLTTMRNADKVMLERTPIPVNAERVFAVPGTSRVLVFESTSGAKVARVDLP